MKNLFEALATEKRTPMTELRNHGMTARLGDYVVIREGKDRDIRGILVSLYRANPHPNKDLEHTMTNIGIAVQEDPFDGDENSAGAGPTCFYLGKKAKVVCVYRNFLDRMDEHVVLNEGLL